MWNGQQKTDTEVPILKPTELFVKREKKDAARLKAYNTILGQIHTRIRTNSKEGGDPWIVFTIPPFIIGLPRIDLEDCVVYLVYILRQQGYEVKYTYPNLLYISWKHHERDYILKNSPIMAAMLNNTATPKTVSSKPGNEILKKSSAPNRVRFIDEVAHSRPSAAASYNPFEEELKQNTTVGRAPPRSSAGYSVPSSFLNALDKPLAEPRKSALDDFLNF